MSTLYARSLVIGYPPLAKIEAASGGRIRLSYGEVSVGVDLETGQSTPPSPAPIVPARLIQLATTRLVERPPRKDEFGSRAVWELGGVKHELRFALGELLAGDDDWLLGVQLDVISLLDRPAGLARSLDVPAPPDLGDIVTGGIRGHLQKAVLLVPPHHLVFVRSPALLAVRLPDLVSALRDEEVLWRIQATLPLHEISPKERLWPPFGHADRVQRPPVEAVIEAHVTTAPLAPPPAPPAPIRWRRDARNVPAPPPPADPRFAALVAHEPPMSAAAALEFARAIQLHLHHGAYGPLAEVHDQLADLTSQSPDGADERRLASYDDLLVGALWHQRSIYEGTAFAIFPLVGILLDRLTLDRSRLAGALATIGCAAVPGAESSDAAPGVRFALERCLAALLEPPVLDPAARRAWGTLLLVIATFRGKPAAWFRRIARHDSELAELLQRFTDGETLDEIVGDNEAL